MRIHLCTVINCTPEETWAAVEDISTHIEWMADAESITFTSDQTSGVGTEFECLTKVGPLKTVDVMTVTSWEPGKRMGIEHRGMVTGGGDFMLSADERGRTIFCWDETLHFPWWMAGVIGEFFGRPVLKYVWRANLRRLKDRAEKHS